MTTPHADDHTPLTPDEYRLAERGASIVAAAMADLEAQAPLRLRAARDRDARRAPQLRRRRGRALGFDAALCAFALAVLVVALRGHGTARGPTVTQVAAMGRLPADRPAPAVRDHAPPTLNAAVEGLRFPDWTAAFGWRPTGSRLADVGGRTVTTVTYRNPTGATLGYSIAAGDRLAHVPPGLDIARSRTRYRVARAAGRTIVIWVQDGHTCVIDAPDAVPAARLVTLAAWAND